MNDSQKPQSFQNLIRIKSRAELTYRELLYTYEWFACRQKILMRDGDKCQNCEQWYYRYWTLEERRQIEEQIEAKPYSSVFSQEEIAETAITDPELANTMSQFKSPNGLTYLTGYVPMVPELKLEIHHKAYIKGLLPWEHPENLMETLCDKCHHERHFGDDKNPPKKRKVYKDISQSDEAELQDCPKCGGLGYLIEYKHVQSGICFSCGGSGKSG